MRPGFRREPKKRRPQTPTITNAPERIYDSNEWHGNGYFFKQCEQDQAQIFAELRYTDIARNTLENALQEGNTRKTQELLKDIVGQADRARNSHELRINHPELLHFTPSHMHPIWKTPPSIACLHARWLVGKTEADDHRCAATRKRCPLCHFRFGGRAHLLSTCPHTKQATHDCTGNITLKT